MQEPLGMERNSMGKDTGFPEPLSHDRNTTLPHPEADTSPYATLESSEFDPYRSHSRLSIKRLHSKTQRVTSERSLIREYGSSRWKPWSSEMKLIEKDVEQQG
ncbi:hypothetical protein DID88_009020 [Monilinia fructigena]|uniref:Uncharacterized protein n=1 Tax=Monilinia fructigena TaxID=38457 RepID=A0A395IFP9_9HELO|nr:hypothetical protein DID88_009020 [Monilinia fructigena]